MRIPQFTVQVMMILVALAALGSFGVRRWTIDPPDSRLPTDSEAVLYPDQPGFAAVYTDVLALRYVKVPNGSRVRVLSDAEPSQIGPITNLNGTTEMGDYRRVRIVVLDGDKSGCTGEVARRALNR